MQKSHNKLKEIVVEITSECNNNCSYCGSKDVSNIKTDEDLIKRLADKIFEYPPEEINISGGDPLLVSKDTHQHIINLCVQNDVVPKIIVNPKSLKKYVVDILDHYDYIGLSINIHSELELAKEWVSQNKNLLDKIVIITNFNLSNIFLYSQIDDFVKYNNLSWQIQYTVYNPTENNDNAIYKIKDSIKFLNDKVVESIKDHRSIAICDNMNDYPCTAGKYSCGITYSGEVVPCLSMRCWENLNNVSQGNLLEKSFQEIWEGEFKKYRFSEFKSCKDVCNAPLEFNFNKKSEMTQKETQEELDDLLKRVNKPHYHDENIIPIVTYYGVRVEPTFDPNIVMAYAVTPIKQWEKDYTIITTSNTIEGEE